MRIEDIIKEKQPKDHKKILKIRDGTKNNKKKDLSEAEIKELMYHPSYKRGSRGAIKQVR